MKTNEELLQQAKDQVAKKYFGLVKWTNGRMGFASNASADNILSEAALLAIQSAREEGQKEWFEKGYLSGAYRASHESWKEAYDKELTDPGR